MTYIWPVKDRVTQEFAANPDPSYQPDGHTGMDFACPEGTPIYAEADGMIVISDWADTLGWPNVYYIATSAITPGGAGIVVGLDTGPYLFIHGHLSRTDLNNGQRVKQGDIIGYTGNTGRSTGAHLHLEILPDGWNVHGRFYGRINPRDVIDGQAAVVPQGAPTPALKPNERMTGGSPVNLRAQPNTAASIVDIIPAGRKEVWEGFVRGERVTGAGGHTSDLWYKDAKGYANFIFFDPFTTDGLPDLTPKPPAPAPVPPPTKPAPVEVPKYDFVQDFTSINGINVEKIPAHWDNYGTDFPTAPAKAVIHWWNAPSARPSLDSVIGEFCHRSTSKSPHFIIGVTRIIQTVSLSDRAFHAGPGGNDFIGIEVDPYVLEKDVAGFYTPRALAVQANVRGLLQALKSKYGYQFPLLRHKDVPGAATACSEIVLAEVDLKPEAVVPPSPNPPTAPPTGTEAELRRFTEWLISQYLKSK